MTATGTRRRAGGPPPRPRNVTGPTRPRASRRARPKLRVVRPTRPRRLPFFLVSLVVVGLLIGAVASVQALVSQSSFRMQELSRQTARLEQRNGRLRLQIAESSSPKSLESAARRLGLTEPGTARILTVKGARTGSGGSGASTGSGLEPDPGQQGAP